MKILHTSDLHFNKAWFEWIARQQDNFDVFCISGDFLDSSQEETLLEQITWIKSWIKNFKKPLFTCSGNHDIGEIDNDNWLCEIDTPNYYSDNAIKIIDGIKFGCYPYIGGDGYYEFADCDVLITHIPPANTQTSIDRNRNEWGDKELYRAIKRESVTPKMILCGHMHTPTQTVDYLEKTMISNPGMAVEKTIPNHNILEIKE